MICIILASGQGTRLHPLTDERPKPLVAIDDTPLLQIQIDALQKYGVEKGIITTGPFADQIRLFAKEYNELDIRFVHNDRYAETNYIYSLWLAEQKLNEWNNDEDVLLLHGDLVFDDTVLEQLINTGADNSVIIEKTPDPFLKDFCATISEGTIEKIDTHLGADEVHQLYPMYKLSRETFEAWLDAIGKMIDQGGEQEYAEVALNDLLSEIELHPIAIDTFCAEVDTQSDLEVVEEWWVDKNGRS